MMTRRRWAGVKVLVLLLALTLVAAACGDDDDAETTTTAAAEETTTTAAADETTTTAAAEETTTTEAAEAEKPLMVVALSDTVNLVEPHTFRSTSAYAVTHAIFEPLIVQAQSVNPDGSLTSSRTEHVGAGAESYTIELTDDGGMLATFNLRQNAKFDDGSDVTASDYEYIFRRSIEGPGYIFLLLPFIGIDSADQLTVLDDYTFQIKANVQSPLFERFMTFQVFGALNQALIDANATEEDPWGFDFLMDKSASSGPYYISEFSPDTQVVLTPNPFYWNPDAVKNAGVVIRTVPDPTQRAQLVRTGELDMASGIPERLIPELEEDPNVVVYDIPTTGVAYLAMNQNLIPNVDVRKAIIHAVPYQALLDQVMFGLAAPAGGVVTSLMETYDPAIGGLYATDLDLAAQYLADSGEADVSLVLGVRESRGVDQEAAVLIQENLRQIGINVEVQVLPDADFAERATGGELPLLIQDWFSWGEDPFYQMQFLTQCAGIPFTNFAQFCNEEYDAIVNEGKFTVDADARQDLSSQAQQIFFDNAVWAPLWSTPRTIVAGRCVTGVDHGGYSKAPQFQHLSKTEDC